MTKADIIAMVGQSQYDEASAILRKLTPGPDPTVQHVVSPAVWESHLPQVEQLALFFELYDDLPSYGMLMYATHAYPEFDERSREVWWGYCLKRICSGNEVVSEPILYALWCDYFENQALVADVWGRVSAHDDLRAFEAILRVSGPVPWSLKAPLYETAGQDPSRHMALLQALVGSAFDAFGKIEPEPARRLLSQLRVPTDAAGYTELKARLGIAGR